MGAFVDWKQGRFSGIADQSVTLLSTTTNTLQIRTLNVCNTTNAPIRFNSKIATLQGGILQKDCYAASTSALAVTYDNGISGVGATLTSTGGSGFSIDDTFPPLNSRILIKDQTDPIQNGIYCVTTIGDSLVDWVLTRSFDYDTPDDILPNDVVKVVNGTFNGGGKWVQTATVSSVGFDPIVFTSLLPTFTQVTNQYPIDPYVTENIIDITGFITLDYSTNPFKSSSFICNTNGYAQVFDCSLNYLVIKELPFI